MQVKGIKRIELESPIPVYDIEVTLYENFVLSNGAVVHNSKDIADAVVGLIDDIFQEGDKVLYVPSVNTRYHIENQIKVTQHLRNQRMNRMRGITGESEFKRGEDW